MIFSNFVQFCKDFAVFPDLTNKTSLHRIFHLFSAKFK